MQSRLSALFAAAAIAAAGPAHAQTSAKPPSNAKTPATRPAAKTGAKPSSKTVDTITVTGESQNAYRSSIDRKSYGIANDLAATTGSISDALKNVPSVEVDVQGNVSLRGDPNVTIMIDGKPSTLFKGPGGAQALQSLSADQFERVEVITNPSAQFSPDGSAGIINLITKQTRRAGRSGSVRLNLGTAGRRNFGASVAYNSNKLTLSADASWRRDPQHAIDDDLRLNTDPATGKQTTFTDAASNRGPLESWNVRFGGDFDPDPSNRISAEARYNNFTFHPDELQDIHVFDAGGALIQQINHIGAVRRGRADTDGSVMFRHKFSGEDHTLNANLDREHTDERNDLRYTDFNLVPALPNLFRATRGRNDLDHTELKVDYSRPMPREGRLKAGYDYHVDDNDYDNIGLTGSSAGDAVNDVTQTNRFRQRMRLNGAYLTYEQPFGDWTALAGVRLEDVRLRLDQLTSGQSNRQAYTRVYPSLHVADRLSDTQQLTFSYSERLQRPGAQDLNGFRFVGLTTASQGNPDLKPQITHSFEAGWQYKDTGTIYGATLYYRRNDHGVTDVVSELPGGVLLTTKANLSQSRSAGLELSASGRLTKTLTYNASTNIYWNEIDATRIPLGPGLGFGTRRSAVSEGGRFSLNWQVTDTDLLQLSGHVNAKRLLPQGYSEPTGLMFLGYRHKFSDALSFFATVQDPFNIYRARRVIDTPTLHEVNTDSGRTRAGFFGLTYSFGVARKRPETFDFSQGPGG